MTKRNGFGASSKKELPKVYYFVCEEFLELPTVTDVLASKSPGLEDLQARTVRRNQVIDLDPVEHAIRMVGRYESYALLWAKGITRQQYERVIELNKAAKRRLEEKEAQTPRGSVS